MHTRYQWQSKWQSKYNKWSKRLKPSWCLFIALSAFFIFPVACKDSGRVNNENTGWYPGDIYSAARGEGAAQGRGLVDLRGIIHLHSIYSHDACDGAPKVEGVYNEQCYQDLRRGLCQSKHDFAMLTDHRTEVANIPYPDTLLYRAEENDQLVLRDELPVASWMNCGEGQTTPLILAGMETSTMPVGLEHHISMADTDIAYGSATPAAIGLLKDAGAVSLVAHTEGWSVEELATLPIDGFEMFNLHASTLRAIVPVLELYVMLDTGGEGLPHPDLTFLPLMNEDDRYLSIWGAVLARGIKRVTVMASDAHRNTINRELADGERVDSYRRMLIAFSNHLLVHAGPDGKWDDVALKEALRAGRLYGAFEIMGYPKGFDYFAETITSHASDMVVDLTEMGGEVTVGATLVAKMPVVKNLNKKSKQPVKLLRLMRATDSGWDEIITSDADLTWVSDAPGAYRVEVTMIPYHLESMLGDFEEDMLASSHVWIYSNPIYVMATPLN